MGGEAVNDLDVYAINVLQEVGKLPHIEHVDDLETAVNAYRILLDAYQALRYTHEDLADKIARRMDDKRYTSQAAGITVERSMKTDRKEWDKESLLRAVLDSRLVDPDTGEVKDPTPLDKVLHVWNLPAPRVTALRERGLDPDEFCRSERLDRWTLRVHGGEL